MKKSNDYIVKDSGKRQEFSTGAIRDTQENKGRFDLIPPIVEERLAKHYENGSAKYGDNNFRLGIPVKRYIDSCRRHLNKYRMGMTDEDHLIAAIWNLAAIVETEYLIELGFLSDELLDGNYYSEKSFESIKKQVLEKNKDVMTSLNKKSKDK